MFALSSPAAPSGVTGNLLTACTWRGSVAQYGHTSRRCPAPIAWLGETAVTIDIPGTDYQTMYHIYSDLNRMTEWSPLLQSVTVDPSAPRFSEWVMAVPRPLQAACRALGYPDVNISWEAELDAPGPPHMSWSSSLRGKAQNAGFIPSGSASFYDAADGCTMTLTLRYELPEPAAAWKVAAVRSPIVQACGPALQSSSDRQSPIITPIHAWPIFWSLIPICGLAWSLYDAALLIPTL